MASSKETLGIPLFINYLKEKASDGKITDEELRHLINFSYLVKGLYKVVYEVKWLTASLT